MTKRRVLIAAAALTALAVPMAAAAGPGWGGQYDRGQQADHGYGDRSDGAPRYGDHGYRDRSGGEPGWRHDDGDGWREHRDWDGGGWARDGYRERDAYYPRCFWQPQGYYDVWGQYEMREVRVCR